ncbi:MAG: hypothetical protein ACE144_06935 [Thermodesulfobacteriota bacterium]
MGLALEALGIESIAALSPQAKGRIERLFGALQDRLIAELCLEGIQSIEAANRFLKVFIPDLTVVLRSLPENLRKPGVRCLQSLIWIDGLASITVRSWAMITVFGLGLILDLPPGPNRHSYAKTQVEVRQLLNGSWRVYYQDQVIAKHLSTELRDPVRALKHTRHIKGAFPEQWVYLASAPSTQVAPAQQGS